MLNRLHLIGISGAAIALAGVAVWLFRPADAPVAGKAGAAPVAVTLARVETRDLPVIAIANGSVVALQAVEVRTQVSSTVKAIHFTEGQFVRQGDLLFTLDARTEEANLKRAEAQALKSRADLGNAERNLRRQRELFDQKFISQAALDTAINQVDVLRGQLAVDEAAADVARVARTLTEIRAPFSGRTGAINVRIGSLVQPQTTSQALPLVTISQIDPIAVAFALPERELPHIQRALARGPVPVRIELQGLPKQSLTGRLAFVESTVDAASGTIAMKAAVGNESRQLWPGMFVNVSVQTRVLEAALTVPVQAVQSGPERKFVYVVGAENKAQMRPVEVELVQGGFAAIKGIDAGARVVVEGAQNVRKDSLVAESGPPPPTSKPGRGEPKPGATGDAQAAKPAATKS
ncbi:MAG TPA: efflux RND transporter periplasmic adaptor subunit [Usitatibacteraceae bacterium]|nr:efflux RND transporter periplasmic adaptor subunit [Usitatibacteraceae bacterium]